MSLVRFQQEEFYMNAIHINFVFDDITEFDGDCIVNSAKPTLGDGQGVCGAIYKKAGRFKLKAACNKLGGCKCGEAKITPGFNLKVRNIIHTVGPINKGKGLDFNSLSDCYTNSLVLARCNNIHSIAFPIISVGAHKFPLDRALATGIAAIVLWLEENIDYDMEVYIYTVDKEAYEECKYYEE